MEKMDRQAGHDVAIDKRLVPFRVGGKPEYPEETPRRHGENMQTPHTCDPGGDSNPGPRGRCPFRQYMLGKPGTNCGQRVIQNPLIAGGSKIQNKPPGKPEETKPCKVCSAGPNGRAQGAQYHSYRCLYVF